MSETASQRDRKSSVEKDMGALSKGSKRVCLPIQQEEYERILFDPIAFRQFLDVQIAQYPELFPQAIAQGYRLHDILPLSKKMPDIRLRRIQVADAKEPNGNVFTIAPSFVMPYMVGYTDDVEKALFLRGKFGVSKIHADASKSKAVSYKRLGELEAELRQEVAELFALAEKVEKGEVQVPEGLVAEDEIALRKERLTKLAEAKAVLEARAQERYEAEQAEYQAKLREREEKARAG